MNRETFIKLLKLNGFLLDNERVSYPSYPFYTKNNYLFFLDKLNYPENLYKIQNNKIFVVEFKHRGCWIII